MDRLVGSLQAPVMTSLHPGQDPLSRRDFLSRALAAGPIFLGFSCAHTPWADRQPPRLAFVTRGRTELIRADGTGRRPLTFDVPNQATWQPSAFFPDGRRILLLSMEPRRDGPGRPSRNSTPRPPPTCGPLTWIQGISSRLPIGIDSPSSTPPSFCSEMDGFSFRSCGGRSDRSTTWTSTGRMPVLSRGRERDCPTASRRARMGAASRSTLPAPEATRSGPAILGVGIGSGWPAMRGICSLVRSGPPMASGWPTRIAFRKRTRDTTGVTSGWGVPTAGKAGPSPPGRRCGSPPPTAMPAIMVAGRTWSPGPATVDF